VGVRALACGFRVSGTVCGTVLFYWASADAWEVREGGGDEVSFDVVRRMGTW
jgi:hypothetical protein